MSTCPGVAFVDEDDTPYRCTLPTFHYGRCKHHVPADIPPIVLPPATADRVIDKLVVGGVNILPAPIVLPAGHKLTLTMEPA